MSGQSLGTSNQVFNDRLEVNLNSPGQATGAAEFSLPFAHLNLRFNPFGEIPLEHRAKLAIADLDVIAERLDDRSVAIQFMGDKGRGKTTHLLALRQRFPHAAYVHIPEGESPPVPVGNPLMIDEVQRLSRWKRFRVFRPDVPLVLGTHDDFAAELKRAGRQVTTIEVGSQLDASKLQQIVERRIEFARRAKGPVPRLASTAIHRLLSELGNDIRAVEGRLYDVFQELREPGDVEV